MFLAGIFKDGDGRDPVEEAGEGARCFLGGVTSLLDERSTLFDLITGLGRIGDMNSTLELDGAGEDVAESV